MLLHVNFLFQTLENVTGKNEPLEKQYLSQSFKDISDDDSDSNDYFTEESEDEVDETENDLFQEDRASLDQNALRLAPKSVQDRVSSLTSHIEERAGDRIKWDDDGTVFVDGEEIRGSNITDILIDLASQRQEKIPKRGTPGPARGLDKVGRILKDTNVSKTLIKNQRRTEQVYGSPKTKEKVRLRMSPSSSKQEKKAFLSFLNWE